MPHRFVFIYPTKNMKQLFVFVSILLIIAGCTGSKKPCEKEIYLIPPAFRGELIVFFDQADGQEMQYEDEARVYNIPSSGFLKTRFPKNGGCMNDDRIHFFYQDSLGDREPMDYFLNLDPDSIPTDRDYVLFTFFSNKDKKPEFVIHMVGHVAEFKQLTQGVNHLQPLRILDSLNNL